MPGVLRGSNLDTETWGGGYGPREEGHVMTEGEITGMLLAAQGC